MSTTEGTTKERHGKMDERPSTEPQIASLLHHVFQAARLDLTYRIEQDPAAVPAIKVELAGPDTPLLVARDGELLRAIEHLTAKILRLEPEQHDLLSVNAGQFKERRDAALAALADQAVAQVLQSGRPYVFAPMSSHERRRLHLVLASSGLRTASTGEGPQRAVVLYPPPTHSA